MTSLSLRYIDRARTPWALEVHNKQGICLYRKWTGDVHTAKMHEVTPDTTTGLVATVRQANDDPDSNLSHEAHPRVRQYLSLIKSELLGKLVPINQRQNEQRAVQHQRLQRRSYDRIHEIPPEIKPESNPWQEEGILQPTAHVGPETLAQATINDHRDAALLGWVEPEAPKKKTTKKPATEAK